jgi:alpha-tubulin suppressor-like RCC1 family protein
MQRFLLTAIVFCTSLFALAQNTTWKTFGAGGPRFFAIKSDGTLWASGLNALGDGSTAQRTIPVQIGSDTNWASVRSGGIHTLALKSDSTLWAWGINMYGQVGDGTTQDKDSPVRIGNDKWLQIGPASVYSFAIRADSTLWAWGRNEGGTLGDGTEVQRNAPVQIGTDKWRLVSAGEGHAAAIKSDGTLWRLGGYRSLVPVNISTENNWVQLHAGGWFVLALKNNGTLWSWGDNYYGQVGIGSTELQIPQPSQVGTDNNWKNIGGGRSHGVASKTDGSVWAWGNNESGQLGDGTTTNQRAPKRIESALDPFSISSSVYCDYTALLSSDKKTFCFTGRNWGQFGNNAGQEAPNGIPVLSYTCENSFCNIYSLATATSSYVLPASGTGNRVDFQNGCKLVSSITASGANPVTGEIRDSVWIEPTVPTTASGQPYVQRHYGITPLTNPGTSTATITLYYSQEDFTAYNAAPNHGLDLPHDATDAANNKVNLRIVKRSGTSSNGTGLYDAYTGGGQVIVPTSVVWNAAINAWAVTFDVTGFSGFFVTSSSVAVILPVRLIDLTARLQENDGLLSWQVTNEVNFSSYEVERSTDGRIFAKIGHVRAVGNGAYQFRDKSLASLRLPVVYYRLQLVSMDGTHTYSKVVPININSRQALITLYPNPVHEAATLSITAANRERLHLQVIDATGRVVVQKTVVVVEGHTTLVLDAKAIAAGTYTLLIRGSETTKELRFIK